MKNTKLFKLLNTFSEIEIKQLELFVNSPFFTSGKNYPSEKLSLFINVLKRNFPFNEKNLPSKEEIFSEIYPGKNYNDPVMRNLFSYLYEFALRYMKLKRFESEEFEGRHYLLMEFFERKLSKEFEKQAANNYSFLEGKEPTADTFYNVFRTDDYNNHYLSGIADLKPLELQKMINSFHMFYVSRVLQVFLPAVNMNNMTNCSFNLPLYNEVIEHIEDNVQIYAGSINVLIYCNLLQMLRNKDEKYYYNLKKLFRKNYGKLESVDRNNIFICLGNFCLDRISEGNEKFHAEKFENDKAYLKSGHIFKKRYFHTTLFLGITMNAVKLKQFEWVKNFLKENSRRLPPAYREYCENYVSAEILYGESIPGEALKKLAVASTDLPYFKQLVRNLKLKIYCDLNYFDEAESVINTSLKFLKSDFGLLEAVKKDMKLFIKYIRLLLKVKQQLKEKNKAGFTGLSLLKNELQSIQHFRNKDWLNDAIGKLSAK